MSLFFSCFFSSFLFSPHPRFSLLSLFSCFSVLLLSSSSDTSLPFLFHIFFIVAYFSPFFIFFISSLLRNFCLVFLSTFVSHNNTNFFLSGYFPRRPAPCFFSFSRFWPIPSPRLPQKQPSLRPFPFSLPEQQQQPFLPRHVWASSQQGIGTRRPLEGTVLGVLESLTLAGGTRHSTESVKTNSAP